MRLEHQFTVPVPVDRAWHLLLDLPRVVPCMPGATLTGVDGDAFTGTVKVKLGPIALTYRGTGRFVERDEDAHRVVVETSGKDVRAAGTAAATVTAVLAGAGEHTTVDVVTDLLVTGRPAQFGRGMIAEVSEKLLGQFTDCLAASLDASPDPDPALDPALDASLDASPDPDPALDPALDASLDPDAATDVATGPDEPVHLLRLTTGTATAKKLAKQGAGVLALLALAWLAVRVLRR